MGDEKVTLTKLENLIDPEVMAPMISAKIDSAIVVTPFAKVDTTLVAQPGDTITVPKYTYIGDAEEVAEGIEAGTAVLGVDKDTYTVKKAVKAVTLTDEAVLSGYGNPVGQTNNQLGLSIASKIDADAITVAQGAKAKKDLKTQIISYEGIVDAIDLFNEELNTEKVMFVNPHQVTELRKDSNFISADKYKEGVILTGEIGKIANTRIVSSKKVENEDGVFNCPIIKLNGDNRTEDDTSALTIFLKRDIMLETERHSLKGTTDFVANKHYVVALTDETKVVVAQFKAPAKTI